MISNEHLIDLRKSGLKDETITTAGVYSVRPADIAKKLGWDSPQIQSMYAIPYPNNDGFERYKLIPPIKDKDGHETKYLQRKGSPVHLYIPPLLNNNVLTNPQIPLAIVEGEKKTLRLIQEGCPAIGIGGIWSWSQNGHATPDLEKIILQGRTIHFFPDSDVWQRQDLLKAVYALARELEKRGANVVIFKLPEGKEKIGVDDYLQQGHGVQELFSLPATTTAGAEFEGTESWLTARKVRRADNPLAQLESVFKTYFNLEDFTSVKVVLSTVLANQAEGDPVWLLLVGAPSSLKSEFIQSLQGLECVYPVSLLTPRTFASGDKTSKDSSLLEQLKDKTIITMKDFGSVLQMRRDDRSEVLAALREIYDGSYTKNFGNGKRVVWEGKLGIIAGCTGIIDEYHTVHQILGERFLLYRLEPCNRAFTVESALRNAGDEKQIRKNIKEAVKAFFQTVKPIPDWTLGTEHTKKVVALSDFVTRARTGVLRDGYSREITYTPEWEGPARFAKQLHRLSYGLSCLAGENVLGDENYKVIFGVAEASIPRLRRDILASLLETELGREVGEITNEANAPERVVYRVLEDLQVLKIVEHQKPFYVLSKDVKQLLSLASP